jgi:3-(methylthio)propanoyl-CoA dehydrogenase
MSYVAPVKDMLFNLKHIAQLESLCQLPSLSESSPETAQAVLEEFARFNQEVIAPLNWTGDQSPSRLEASTGLVHTSPGFAEAYAQFIEAGWQGLEHPTQFGGQGFAKSISAACAEMLNSANLSFALCPLLTDGAIEALRVAGSPALQAQFLPHLVSGRWSGTMNLTEPQAGSDLSLLQARAQEAEGGGYHLFGTKIYITYGEHDFSENIVHMVLARLKDAPAGVKGISLFLVPKYKLTPSGELGERNDVHCVQLEHKLGIKASPTAVMKFGENGGAHALMVGEPNRGLEYMFVMMNAARFSVGVQGVALAERAYQAARRYALERVQSRALDQPQQGPVAIVQHPDVKRMLMTMRAYVQSARALSCAAAKAYDLAHHHPDEAVRLREQRTYEFMVPLVKGYSTEMSQWVSSMAVQVHGGMGFIEETGVAQYYRDAKILTIYEGTTGIQANDLLGRKTFKDRGETARALLAQMQESMHGLSLIARPQAQSLHQRLQEAREAYELALTFVIEHHATNPLQVYAGGVPFLILTAQVMAGWQMAKSLVAAHQELALGEDLEFHQDKLDTAHFYAQYILTQSAGLAQSIVHGGESVNAYRPERL